MPVTEVAVCARTHVHVHMSRATKNIRAGDEVLVSYGYQYWLFQLSGVSETSDSSSVERYGMTTALEFGEQKVKKRRRSHQNWRRKR